MTLRLFHLLNLLGLALMCAIARADPPGRVGRLADVQGVVMLRQSGYDEVQQAVVNWPITSGHELVTNRGAYAEISLGAASFRLAGESTLTILQLDDQHVRLRLHGGSIQVRARNASLAREIELETAQGRVLFSEPATVRIDSLDNHFVTTINVVSGSASFDGGGTRFALTAGRRAEVDASGLLNMTMRSNARDDDFDWWVATRDREQQQLSQRSASRYTSADMAGYEVLDSYGNWRTTVEYGPIWSPSILPAGWAPYRDGRWTWIAPWGWTWVDHAPWGYAPSHYGRWVFYEQRWCWTPGSVATRPVWAPAVVGWVGGSGWQVTGSTGGPSIAWFALAPREVYVPAYQATPRYVQQINNSIAVNGSVPIPISRPANGRAALYQNQSLGNAITAVPSYQFGVSKTVVVPAVAQRSDSSQPIRNAPAAPNTFVTPARSAVPLSQAYRSPPPQAQIEQGRFNRGAALVTIQPTAPAPMPAATVAPRQPSQPVTAPPASRAIDYAPPPGRAVASLAAPASPLAASPPQGRPAEGRSEGHTRRRSIELNEGPQEQRQQNFGGGFGRSDHGGAREGFGRGSLQR